MSRCDSTTHPTNANAAHAADSTGATFFQIVFFGWENWIDQLGVQKFPWMYNVTWIPWKFVFDLGLG